MDADRFDTIMKLFVDNASRRRLLRRSTGHGCGGGSDDVHWGNCRLLPHAATGPSLVAGTSLA
jgi:hypothetical protein